MLPDKDQPIGCCGFLFSFSEGYNTRMMSTFGLGIFDLVSVIVLVLASSSLIYLLRIKNKTGISKTLSRFFLCIILSSTASIITNIGTPWDWAFALSQDAFLIFGGVFLVRFAYLYPQNDQPQEARWIFTFFTIVGLGSLFYALSFTIRYISNLPQEISENQAFYLLTPIVIILIIIIFLRRSIHISTQTSAPAQKQTRTIKSIFRYIVKPPDRSAIALRNYGLSLTLSLAPVIVVLMKGILPGVLEIFLFNFGTVLAITAIIVTYINYPPEPTNISEKLVGISLVSILLILGLAGVLVYTITPGLDEHRIFLSFIILVLFSSILVILVFPLFFRAALLDPLARLLKGVKLINDGKLDVGLAVQYNDEIGELTQSFNSMAGTLRQANATLRERASALEEEVSRRTADLTQTNVRLENENNERIAAEERLYQQLIYQQALSNCSKAFLVEAEDQKSRLQILNQVLGFLCTAVQVSRAYIFNTFEDAEVGPCIGMVAEVSAEGIPSHINNPVNRKYPISGLPCEFVSDLTRGKPFGGPTKKVFADTPVLIKNFLAQTPPLLSMMTFPLFNKNRLWGFIGFDDCLSERDWDQNEIAILRTASEMIGNSMQRWQAEDQLRKTLDLLEERVKERTIEYLRANDDLKHEILERQRFQVELEGRLEIERILANISTRLLEPARIRENIKASLQDLGQILDAGRIFVLEIEPQDSSLLKSYIEWCRPGIQPLPDETIQVFMESLRGLASRLRKGETISIDSSSAFPPDPELDMQFLQTHSIRSMVLAPLDFDQRLHGLLGCSNLQAAPDIVQMNIRILELVAGMLKSLLQREYLIQTLEEQVAERTRQLTTLLDMAILSDQPQDLSDMLQPTLHSIIEISDCDAAGIHIFEAQHSSLELVAQRGIPQAFLQALKVISIDQKFQGWWNEAACVQVLGDRDGNSVFLQPFYLPGYRIYYANCLNAGNKLLGLLSCYRITDRPFSPFQTTLLSSLSELLGIIVENYRLRIEAQNLAAVEERQRLAREIHDAISQSVYSLSLFARSAMDALDDGSQAKVLASLQDIETTALLAMKEMRLLLYQLREAGSESDIASALETRFKQVENRLGIEAAYDIGEDVFLKNHIQHEVWRILIEALNNAVKHANARHVYVHISCLGEALLVSIQDDGIGFTPDSQSPGMGLKNIQSRTETLAGQLEIISAPGQGTLVNIKVPNACTSNLGGNGNGRNNH
jgi:signal transduction histidine kinase/HAMP domain-containing protein